ncbi:MAG: type II toxin-antitoxin system HipA family toxin [Anaerolineaceae bacterium]
MSTTARVILWGNLIGAVTWDDSRGVGVFQYASDFLPSGIQLSPLMMPLSGIPYEFPALPPITFRGLPGLLSDSLPDKFGNAIIDAWLASHGRSIESFNSVERLCYVGNRGMGGLEFEPALLAPYSGTNAIEVADLVDLSNRILDQRTELNGIFNGKDDHEAIENILRVGTSAGGARAKAILAWNPKTNEFRSGQIPSSLGFEYWIMKFDGISSNRDKELTDPQGYGKIEYAYSLMAGEAGISMAPCRLHHEGGRSHFMTKRFDRTDEGKKLHMQSLCAIAHIDYNQAGIYSYEQALNVMKRMQLSSKDLEQQVLRAMFNVVGRNQDDHVKNIAFLMTPEGEWILSPAFDVTYAYSPQGEWTGKHQMILNGKRDQFTRDDLIALAQVGGIKPKKATDMIERVLYTVNRWPEFAEIAGVDEKIIARVRNGQRLKLE